MTTGVVIDTNILVAAGFKKKSASGRIVEAVAANRLVLVWNQATREESLYIVGKIPPLDEEHFAGLFRSEGRFDEPLDEVGFEVIADQSDRKFAALAAAAGVVLVSNDSDFLDVRESLAVEVMRPSEFIVRSSGD